jgi:hypothetical protein
VVLQAPIYGPKGIIARMSNCNSALSMAVVVPLEVLISKVALLGDEAAPDQFHRGPGWKRWRGHSIFQEHN